MQRPYVQSQITRPGDARDIVNNIAPSISSAQQKIYCSHRATESPGSDVPRVSTIEMIGKKTGVLYN